MSMHDVEAFAEGAVMFVYNASLSYDEKLALIHNIYRFHDMWDTGFTKLRVFDILVNQGYMRLFMPWEDQAVEKYASILPEMEGKAFDYIYEDPTKPWSEKNPVACYWIGGIEGNTVKSFACDASQPLWSALTGRTLPEMEPEALIIRLAEIADERNDYEMKGDLYYIMIYLLFDLQEGDAFYQKLKELLWNKQTAAAAKKNWGSYLDWIDDSELDALQAQWLEVLK